MPDKVQEKGRRLCFWKGVANVRVFSGLSAF